MKLHSLLLLVLLPGAALSAQVTLPTILTSHMVVQRDLPVHVWGMARRARKLAVTFRGESQLDHGRSAGPLEPLSEAGRGGRPV